MAMESKLVSVIMPAYNGEKYIENAVQSMLMQSYLNWELIVVDDGSTDNTAPIIKAMTDVRIKYVYQENRGQASALNTGLMLAKGDYITTLDCDDWFTNESILARVQFLDHNPEFGVVYGDGIYCNVNGEPIMHFSENRVGDIKGDVYDTLIVSPFFGTGGNVMVRRGVFEIYDIKYDEAIVWCQDYDLYIRIAEYAPFGVIDTVTVWYRLHDENMTMSMSKGRRLESILRLRGKVLSSPRFASAKVDAKYHFFHYLIIYDLDLRLDEQIKLFDHPRFQEMEKARQAQMIRHLAIGYLFVRKHIDEMRVLLRRAWKLNPFDFRTILLVILAAFNGKLADRVFDYWRQIWLRKHTIPSPFTQVNEKAS